MKNRKAVDRMDDESVQKIQHIEITGENPNVLFSIVKKAVETKSWTSTYHELTIFQNNWDETKWIEWNSVNRFNIKLVLSPDLNGPYPEKNSSSEDQYCTKADPIRHIECFFFEFIFKPIHSRYLSALSPKQRPDFLISRINECEMSEKNWRLTGEPSEKWRVVAIKATTILLLSYQCVRTR